MECQTNCRCGGKIFGALLIAAGLACGGFFPGYYYYQAKLKATLSASKGWLKLMSVLIWPYGILSMWLQVK